ncbi:MAG: SUMF1/EgtB/PvdO family nonheme iron enzyme [Chloroflexota bacterium]
MKTPKHKSLVVFWIMILMLVTSAATPLSPSQIFNTAQTLSLSGRVTDDLGNGIEGVTITVVYDPLRIFLPLLTRQGSAGSTVVSSLTESGQNFYTVMTDNNGFYSLDSLPAGRYLISAHKNGQDFTPISYTVTLPSSESEYNFQTITIPTVYSAGTINLSEETLDELTSISADGWTFTFASQTQEIAGLKPGDVIIGGITPLTPDGFLRRVISISSNGDQRIILTESAMLEDAFESLSIHYTQQLTPEQVQNFTDIPGITLLDEPSGLENLDFKFSMNNAVLYDQDNNLSTTGDQVVANGLLTVSPEIEFRIRIENGSLEELYFTSSMSVETGFSVSSLISLTALSAEKSLAPTIHLGAIPVGPLVLKPELDLIAGISGSIFTGISTSITNSTTFTAGLWHVNHQNHNLSQFTTNFSYSPLNFQNGLSFDAFVGPKVSIKIYGVLGGYVKPGIGLNLTIAPAADPWLALSGGLSVSVGASVTLPIINKDLLDVQFGAINYSINLYSLSNNPNHQPIPPSNPSPSDGINDLNLTILLGWDAIDADGDSLVFDVYFDADNPTPTSIVADHTSSFNYNPGTLRVNTTYYWRVIAFDEHGLYSAGPVWSFTTGNGGLPPASFKKLSPANSLVINAGNVVLDWEPSIGAAAYSYCVDNTNDNYCSNWISTGINHQVSIQGLNENTIYYWQVRASNSTGVTYADGNANAYWKFNSGDDVIVPGEMVLIPAGEFQMGCDPAHNYYTCSLTRELPLHTVNLSAYLIDKYEVTNTQYAECVSAGVCTPPSRIDSQTRPSYYGNNTYANYPVIYVDWNQANTYCVWAGKRLPTEAEWEKAARGATPRAFPWGDLPPDCTLANANVGGSVCVGDTNAIGSYPYGVSPYGVLDLAGNVEEWISDWYDANYYASSPANNPSGPASGTEKVIRGLGWASQSFYLRTAYRGWETPSTRSDTLGFRCADTP